MAHAWHLSALYGNEVFFFIPFVSWGVVRTEWTARVLDCLRTWPLIVYAAGVAGGWPVTVYVALGIGLYTAAMNIAMYREDARSTPPFTPAAQILYALSYVSPISFIVDRPGRGAVKKTIVVVGNVACVTYVLYQVVVAVTLADAWACYPRDTPFANYDRGFCPQRTGDYYNSEICREEVLEDDSDTQFNPMCDVKDWNLHAHEILPAHVHIIINFLAVTVTVYAYQVWRSVRRRRQGLQCSVG